MQKNKKEPLYRKINKTTVSRTTHETIKNPDSKYDRGTKKGIQRGMGQTKLSGYDYTPLFRFLFSKVGEDWDLIYSEALSRLDSEEPIYYIVAKDSDKLKSSYRIGENSYFSGLYIDDNNLLQLVDPSLKNEDFKPICSCCTYTFNGKVLINKYNNE